MRQTYLWMLASLAAGTLVTPDRGFAATISYDLSGDVSSQYVTTDASGTWHFIDLTDAITGAPETAATYLSRNDTITATVTLNAPWSIPASGSGAFLGLILGSFADNSSYVELNETGSFYLNGSKLAAPTWLGIGGGAPGGFEGVDTGGLGLAAEGPGDITFTSFVVTAQVVDIGQTDGGPTNAPLSVQPNYPRLGYTLSPVPLPGTFWLLLSALLGGLCLHVQRTRLLLRNPN